MLNYFFNAFVNQLKKNNAKNNTYQADNNNQILNELY